MAIIPDKRDREPLLPVRHPQADFFVADVLDAAIKDDMASMEHPMFTLSTKPDLGIRSYTTSRGDKVEIAPSTHGLATVFDKDILIYCISQLIEGMNQGRAPSRTIHIQAQDYLKATNRRTDGDDYERLRDGLKRLNGTTLTTTIETNGESRETGFHLLEDWETVRKSKSGRMVAIEITLSKWLYNAILGKEVLTLHRDYFRLRSPLERRIYEVARKHCGRKMKWSIGLEKLHQKSGSSAPLRRFRLNLRKVIERNDVEEYFPDFQIGMEDDLVTFVQREKWWEQEKKPELSTAMRLAIDTVTLEQAKPYAVRVGGDLYAWQDDWHRHWEESGRPPVPFPDQAFLAFCKARAQHMLRR